MADGAAHRKVGRSTSKGAQHIERWAVSGMAAGMAAQARWTTQMMAAQGAQFAA